MFAHFFELPLVAHKAARRLVAVMVLIVSAGCADAAQQPPATPAPSPSKQSKAGPPTAPSGVPVELAQAAPAPPAVAPAPAPAPTAPQKLAVGDVRIFAFSFAPVGYIPCDGRHLMVEYTKALHDITGDRFGVSPKGAFMVPKLPPLRAAKAKGYEDVAASAGMLRPAAVQIEASASKIATACGLSITSVRVLNEIEIKLAADAGKQPPEATLETQLAALHVSRRLAGELAVKGADALAAVARLQQAAAGDKDAMGKVAPLQTELSDSIAALQKVDPTVALDAIAQKLATLLAEAKGERDQRNLKNVQDRVASAQAAVRESRDAMATAAKELGGIAAEYTVDLNRCIIGWPVDRATFLGEVKLMAIGFSPQGWMPCEGQLLKIKGHEALYSLLGPTFGGDGKETFGLPRLPGPQDGTQKFLQYHIAIEGAWPGRN